LKKWLKPTSYKVAADANVEMWPPMPSLSLLARTTIDSAFQRTRLLMRRSSTWLPGNAGCCDGGMLLTYGVFAVKGSR
jgi:hypothetical protein